MTAISKWLFWLANGAVFALFVLECVDADGSRDRHRRREAIAEERRGFRPTTLIDEQRVNQLFDNELAILDEGNKVPWILRNSHTITMGLLLLAAFTCRFVTTSRNNLESEQDMGSKPATPHS